MKLLLENKVKISENLRYHLNNKLPLTEDVFRLGSDSWVNLISEVRTLYNSGTMSLTEDEVELINSDIGKKAIFEGDEILLDVPYVAETIGNDKLYGVFVEDNGLVKQIFFTEDSHLLDESEDLFEGDSKKDACYHKVKSRYKKWPSAYASGALVKCRKVGAKNWGKSTKESISPELAQDLEAFHGENLSEKSDFSKEKESGLHGWFSRQGGKGKSKGWVDCNTCKKGKNGKKTCKACGRGSGEKRSKYPRCRPTPSQCSGYRKPKNENELNELNNDLITLDKIIKVYPDVSEIDVVLNVNGDKKMINFTKEDVVTAPEDYDESTVFEFIGEDSDGIEYSAMGVCYGNEFAGYELIELEDFEIIKPSNLDIKEKNRIFAKNSDNMEEFNSPATAPTKEPIVKPGISEPTTTPSRRSRPWKVPTINPGTAPKPKANGEG